MASLKLQGNGPENVYELTGIEVGSSLMIQNQSVTYVEVYFSKDQPDEETASFVLAPLETRYVDGNIEGVWLEGRGPVSVGEA